MFPNIYTRKKCKPRWPPNCTLASDPLPVGQVFRPDTARQSHKLFATRLFRRTIETTAYATTQTPIVAPTRNGACPWVARRRAGRVQRPGVDLTRAPAAVGFSHWSGDRQRTTALGRHRGEGARPGLQGTASPRRNGPPLCGRNRAEKRCVTSLLSRWDFAKAQKTKCERESVRLTRACPLTIHPSLLRHLRCLSLVGAS